MMNIHLLDISPSYVKTTGFAMAINQILEEMKFFGGNATRVFAFSETVHELTKDDIIELRDTFVLLKESEIDMYDRIEKHFGIGTSKKAILELLDQMRELTYTAYEKIGIRDTELTIYSDFDLWR